jgi:hypothetical protein
MEDLKAKFQDKIDAAETYSEFCIELLEIKQALNNQQLFYYLFDSARFKGKGFVDYLEIKFYTKSVTLKNEAVVTGIPFSDMRYCFLSSTNNVKTCNFKHKKGFTEKHMYSDKTKYDYTSVAVGKPLLIVYENDDDALKYAPSRFKMVMEEFRHEYNVLWIKSQSSNPFREFFRISCQLGHPKIKIINLAHVERQAPEKRERIVDNCFYKVWKYSNWRRAERYYDTDKPPVKNAYYVNLFRNSEVFDGQMSMGNLCRAKELLVERNFLEDWPIVGVHKSNTHYLKACPEWVLLEDEVLKAAKKSISENDVFEYEIARLMEEKIGGTVQENLKTVLKICAKNHRHWSPKKEEIGLRASMKRKAKETCTWDFFAETRRLEVMFKANDTRGSHINSLHALFSTEEMIALHPTPKKRAQAEFAFLDTISEEFVAANPLLEHMEINHESINALRKYMNLLD